jgi:hypothetical protein
MAVYQGARGRIKIEDDFLGFDPDYTWPVGGGILGRFMITSVNEGSFENTVDEPNGILAVTTDNSDDDNIALYVGPFRPIDGTMSIEARIKANSATLLAMWVGFTETLAKDTPVVPGEFATATLTTNGTGGMAGMLYDPDGTTDVWRAHMGDAGVGIAGTGTTGTVAIDTLTADKYDVVRVELYPSGYADMYLNGALVKHFSTGTALTNTDLFYATVMAENRSAAVRLFEVDYIDVEAGRKWDE